MVVFADDAASEAQAQAVMKICSGADGGLLWGLLAATVERFDGPVRAKIAMHIDGRRSHFRITDILAVRAREEISRKNAFKIPAPFKSSLQLLLCHQRDVTLRPRSEWRFRHTERSPSMTQTVNYFLPFMKGA